MLEPNRISVTRSYWLGIPKYRTVTRTAQPTNWAIFHPLDFVLLILSLVINWTPLQVVAVIAYVIFYPILVFMRLRRRRLTVCARSGHTPEWFGDETRCVVCDTSLPADSELVNASNDVRTGTPPQARYSDRR